MVSVLPLISVSLFMDLDVLFFVVSSIYMRFSQFVDLT